MRTLAARTDRWRWWQRFPLAAGAGALTALAFAPWHLLPALIPGFGALALLLLHEKRPVRGFLHAWVFGAGFFLVSLHWVGYAFLVEAERFAALMPFAVALLALGLALFHGVAGALTVLAPAGWPRIPAFAAAMGASEWLRSWVLTGFPWHIPGYAVSASDAWLQTASLIGITGLTPLVVLLSAWPATFFAPGERSFRIAGIGILAAILLGGGSWLWGAERVASGSEAAYPGIRLRLVQGGIPQSEKWQPELRDRNLQRYLDLSRGAPTPTHVIWPETATPFLLENDLPRRLRTAETAVPPGGLLMTGTPRHHQGASGPAYYNGVVAMDAAARIVADYDKVHLVPFGEYLPMRPLLSWLGLEKLAAGRGDFSPAPEPALMSVPGLPPVRPLICYEILFPAEVTATARPDWLLNLSNDAWFGDGAGPRQHFQIARARAVELGLAVVRATNTGISAVIDPFGRIGPRLGLGESGAIDSALPMPLPATPYARFGNAGFAAVEAFLLALALAPLAQRRRRGG